MVAGAGRVESEPVSMPMPVMAVMAEVPAVAPVMTAEVAPVMPAEVTAMAAEVPAAMAAATMAAAGRSVGGGEGESRDGRESEERLAKHVSNPSVACALRRDAAVPCMSRGRPRRFEGLHVFLRPVW